MIQLGIWGEKSRDPFQSTLLLFIWRKWGK